MSPLISSDNNTSNSGGMNWNTFLTTRAAYRSCPEQKEITNVTICNQWMGCKMCKTLAYDPLFHTQRPVTIHIYFLAIFHVKLLWRHNGHDGVSNHRPDDCVLNRSFRRISKKTSKLRVTGLCAGNSPGPVNSPHKGPVTRKMLPFDDVIMKWVIYAPLFPMLYQSQGVKDALPVHITRVIVIVD